jgi:hypothetical protein
MHGYLVASKAYLSCRSIHCSYIGACAQEKILETDEHYNRVTQMAMTRNFTKLLAPRYEKLHISCSCFTKDSSPAMIGEKLAWTIK